MSPAAQVYPTAIFIKNGRNSDYNIGGALPWWHYCRLLKTRRLTSMGYIYRLTKKVALTTTSFLF